MTNKEKRERRIELKAKVEQFTLGDLLNGLTDALLLASKCGNYHAASLYAEKIAALTEIMEDEIESASDLGIDQDDPLLN